MSAQQQDVAVITRAEVAEQRKLIPRFADRYGVDQDKLLTTLENTAFKQQSGRVSHEQMMALLVVAEQHGLNPFTREIFAFPSQGGIVPVVSVDGWAKLMNSHPQFDGVEFEQDDEKCTCTIFRKDRSHPIRVTEYLAECKRGTTPWQTHPKRMLRHKALIQANRIAFSFAGIYDPDEAEAIVANEIDVTPGNEAIPDSTGKVAPKRLRVVVEGMLKAVADNDAAALHLIDGELNSEQQLFVWDKLRSWERSSIKKLMDSPAYKAAASGLDLPAWSIQLLAGSTLATLAADWKAIQDLYAENDLEVPGDIETVYVDRKTELGAQ